jgi:hypothetical protein
MRVAASADPFDPPIRRSADAGKPAETTEARMSS